MPKLRKLTSRLWLAFSPSQSAATSPTSPAISSFSVISGRKEGGPLVTRLDQHHSRSYSLMTCATNSSKETVEDADKKPRRMSRFREELDAWNQ